MIETASLWVSHPQLMLERVGGLTVLERQLWTIRRAGLRRLWIACPRPEASALASMRLPEDLELTWVIGRGISEGQGDVDPPYIGISGDHLLRVEILTHIRSNRYPGHVAFEDEDQSSVVQVIPYRTESAVSPEKIRLPEGSSVPLASPVADGPALDWICATGFKPQDGFMARHFDRYISLSITQLVLDTRLSPTLMSLLSCLIGLGGAAFFLRPGRSPALAGAVLIWLHSVLDGCDGELARIRFEESDRGADVDFWADNLVHFCLFAALGLGFFREGGGPLSLVLGSAACGGIVGSATLAFRRRAAERRARSRGLTLKDPVGLLARIEQILVQRDFIYLLLVMAYADMAYQFLWAGAVGAPLFMIMMFSTGHFSAAATAETAR